MKLKSKKEGNRLTIYLIGRVNVKTASEFEDGVMKMLDDVTDLTLDLSELQFISSSGLRSLLKIQKKMNFKGTMTVVNVNDDIMEVFRLTGFDNFLNIQ